MKFEAENKLLSVFPIEIIKGFKASFLLNGDKARQTQSPTNSLAKYPH